MAVGLQRLGNPGNMGLCVACMLRDIAGALGLHRAATVQYLRPEVMGLLLGATASAWVGREFRARGGGAPLVRFCLGFLAMLGALVFLGCPWRALLRLAAGDANAVPGLAGLMAGVGEGVAFLKAGFTLGRSHPNESASAWVMPALMLGLLLLAVFSPELGRVDGRPTGPVFASVEGPGSQHAPLFLSLAAGLACGVLAQRTRFCTVGGIRDVMLMRDFHLLGGAAAFLGTASVLNVALGSFKWGFTGQPLAHSAHVWNFAGMALAGLAFTLAGGCPGRQLVMAGEGDADAGVFVLGMLVGAGFAHNLSLASSPAGPGAYGPAAVLAGLAVTVVIGLTLRKTAVR
jgi:YedE family putative selenium metabolism protein